MRRTFFIRCRRAGCQDGRHGGHLGRRTGAHNRTGRQRAWADGERRSRLRPTAAQEHAAAGRAGRGIQHPDLSRWRARRRHEPAGRGPRAEGRRSLQLRPVAWAEGKWGRSS